MAQIDDILFRFRQCGLFTDISDEVLTSIALKVRIVSFAKDDIVFREGDVGDSFYIVHTGEMAAFKETGLGLRELKCFTPGEIFGEMALISHDRRSATVKALVASSCIEINQQTFAELLSEQTFTLKIMELLALRLKRSDDRSTQDILNAHHALIFSLSYLSESRDTSIGAHLYRVREYCALMAHLLAKTPKYEKIIHSFFIENIYNVSPLHDIGKIAISDSILLKNGKLTPEEFDIIKTHTTSGAKSIAIVFAFCENETFQMAYNIALYHHEWYDGKGYPYGLSGEKIPLEARIAAVADVYDALLSKRIYKPSFDYDVAHDEVQRLSGKQFDPFLVDLMMKNIERFKAINEKYKNQSARQ